MRSAAEEQFNGRNKKQKRLKIKPSRLTSGGNKKIIQAIKRRSLIWH